MNKRKSLLGSLHTVTNQTSDLDSQYKSSKQHLTLGQIL